MPRELELMGYVTRFGAAAVFGRTPGAGELRRMIAAENVVNAYNARKASENWAEWASANPAANRLLIKAMQAAEEVDDAE
jgi:hypothetical protein